MDYKWEKVIMKRTFRWTRFNDDISRYSQGSTERYTDKTITYNIHWHQVMFGLYILSNNWFLPTNCKNATKEPTITYHKEP
ncbi:MAG: hypothetical protein GY861_05695 [bacterium]|nr:hypothetical protein [bacterium]